MESHLLTNLRCGCCSSALSVPPILLDINEKNICGRCKSNVPDGSFIHNFHYEVLAQQFSFPCKYANDGCLSKTPFNKVRNHEQECHYRTIICKYETCHWSGIPTEFILHFQEHHNDQTMINGCLIELRGNQQVYVLIIDNFMFLVECSLSIPVFTIKVNSLNLPYNHYQEIIFDMVLVTKDVETTTTFINSVQLNSSKQLILPSSSVLSLSLDTRLPNIATSEDTLKKVTCPNCSSQMVPPILRCPKGHITCVNCTDKDYDYCEICDEDQRWFERVLELELLAATILYRCKWEGCDSYYNISEIESHQLTCCKRMYMCLHCPYWTGYLAELSDHNESCSSRQYLCPIVFATEITLQGNEIRINEDYCEDQLEYILVAHQELFYVIFHRNSSEIEVAICNCGPPSCFSWYNYEVHLRNTEHSHFCSSKVYTYNYKSRNRYTVKIPQSDIAALSSSKCFEVTVQIHKLSGDEKKKNVAKYLNSFNWRYVSNNLL